MLSNLLRDLAEVGHALCADPATELKLNTEPGKVEEEFTVARLFINKMKSEAKNLAQRCSNLESQQQDSNKKVHEYEKDLGECRLLISQHEARMKSLQVGRAHDLATVLFLSINQNISKLISILPLFPLGINA